MKIIKTVSRLREFLDIERAMGRSIGLVPTMGALHQGHMSLVCRALDENDCVVVSDFVNPTQFNNPNDLLTYPRTEEADARLLTDAGVDVMFLPSVEEMYPEGNDTRVFPLGRVAEVMEGAQRPGHFNGVCQIVSKLFDIVRPDRAYFGEKDFQQIAVIRRMLEITGQDVDIVACPICRADSGLALSSRNARLSVEQLATAPAIHRILAESIPLMDSMTPAEVMRSVTDSINAIPGMEVEYYDIVHPRTLETVTQWSDDEAAVGCVTVWMGDVRLIDNIRYTK